MRSPWDMLMQLASDAMRAGEVPVSALIMHQGRILTSAHNQVEALHNPTAHAEMMVLHDASRLLHSKNLSACDLYVTLEPCVMCAGAIAHARVRRVYFGAYDAKAGAIDSGIRLFQQPSCHHHPETYGGFYESAFTALLRDFFAEKRCSP
jgi:tRNA(adenine34) deaminase